MIQTTVVPDKKNVIISLSVPENYIGKEMEVVAFTKEEGLVERELKEKQVSFTAISIDTTGFRFNRNETNER